MVLIFVRNSNLYYIFLRFAKLIRVISLLYSHMNDAKNNIISKNYCFTRRRYRKLKIAGRGSHSLYKINTINIRLTNDEIYTENARVFLPFSVFIFLPPTSDSRDTHTHTHIHTITSV